VKKLTAKTRKGITSIMMRVDFTPMALKNPTDPRTESITTTTPERPNNTWKTKILNWIYIEYINI